MKTLPISKIEFDAKAAQLRALATDWADRETTPFDAAVRRAAGIDEGGGSIWDMPAVDSKRAVSLLTELEPVLGCKIPCSVIKRGGYVNGQEVVDHILAKVRDLCVDGPGLAATAPSNSNAAQVLP